jgi:hypothetical protein
MSIEMAVSVSHNQFTAHNIRLPDGTETWPEGTLLEEYGSFRAPVRMLKLVFPEGLRDKSIADLGCLEGGFTTGFWAATLSRAGRLPEVKPSCRYCAFGAPRAATV